VTVTHAAEPRPSGDEQKASERILVVDDEPGIRHIIARILLDVGYWVHEASDGLEALELINRRDVILDIVVSDIVMPRLNGVELLQELSRSHPSLPIILISGYGTEELAHRGIASPCAVLSKPFPSERLIAEVRRCIAERQ
jgi:two-component system, cell cycle sensor histidine kinase and response regulator CckA